VKKIDIKIRYFGGKEARSKKQEARSKNDPFSFLLSPLSSSTEVRSKKQELRSKKNPSPFSFSQQKQLSKIPFEAVPCPN